MNFIEKNPECAYYYIEKYLNEKLGRTDINNVDVSIACEVDWVCDLEVRDWGVKGIYSYATKVRGSVFYTIWGDPADEEEKELDIESLGFEIVSQIEPCAKGETICVSNVEINFAEKKITVS